MSSSVVGQDRVGEQAEIRPRFQPTHRVRIGFPGDGVLFAGTFVEDVRIEGVATERGFYWAGFTAADWQYGLSPRFMFDTRGRVWVGGELLPPTVPVAVEQL